MRAVSAGLIAVVAIAAVAVWSTRQSSDDSQANSGASPQNTAATVAGESAATGTNSGIDTPASQSVETTRVDEQTDAVSTAEQSDRADPFRVVEDTEVDTPIVDDVVEPQVQPTQQLVETTVDEAGTERQIVNIPAGGYPVEDAMKYYVPKHLRGPGNLGGPPPPAFMVPEDENGVRSVESMLPPAPGQ